MWPFRWNSHWFLNEAPIAGGMMVSQAKRIAKIKGLMIALCLVIGAGCLFNFVTDFADIVSLVAGLPGTSCSFGGETIQYLAISLCSDALDVVSLVIFIFFALTVVRKGEIFSKNQTKRLLVVAVILLVQVLFGLFMPLVSLSSLPGYATDEVARPTLDLRTLSFSITIFIFAAISEYGRILQEDSDNIL